MKKFFYEYLPGFIGFFILGFIVAFMLSLGQMTFSIFFALALATVGILIFYIKERSLRNFGS